jgi:TetR/AcrR family transcriptional repressor of nem operon
MPKSSSSSSPATRSKLLDAGVEIIRHRGYNGATVDDICQAAGVTKGGFFHYFDSKDDLAEAALATFDEARTELFREAAFRRVADPLERVFARLDFEKSQIDGLAKSKGCLAGMLAQELALSRDQFRTACRDFFARRADDFAQDLAAAKALYAPQASFDPRGVALFFVGIMQGSHILAKSFGNNEMRLMSLEHFRTYLRSLFGGEAAQRGARRGKTRAGKVG